MCLLIVSYKTWIWPLRLGWSVIRTFQGKDKHNIYRPHFQKSSKEWKCNSNSWLHKVHMCHNSHISRATKRQLKASLVGIIKPQASSAHNMRLIKMLELQCNVANSVSLHLCLVIMKLYNSGKNLIHLSIIGCMKVSRICTITDIYTQGNVQFFIIIDYIIWNTTMSKMAQRTSIS